MSLERDLLCESPGFDYRQSNKINLSLWSPVMHLNCHLIRFSYFLLRYLKSETEADILKKYCSNHVIIIKIKKT